jgi:hypothetical protein
MFKSESAGGDMYQEIYYVAYFSLCAALVALLARLLHRSGTAFLQEGFRDNPETVRALGRMLQMGLYLVSAGYVALSFPIYGRLQNAGQAAAAIVGKLGGFLLLLGFLHFFNLLILAIFRRRSIRIARAGDLV